MCSVLSIAPLDPPIGDFSTRRRNMTNSTSERMPYMQAHIDDSHQPKLLATLIICVVLAYVVVTLRFVARHKVRASIGADDVWIIIALVGEPGQQDPSRQKFHVKC